MKLLIKDARLIDPANKIDAVKDILIVNGRIAKVGKNIQTRGSSCKIIAAKDKIACPGLIDMHAHLRQPGREDEETLLSGSSSAAKGGFTTVACMANTTPAIDDQAAVEYILAESQRLGLIKVLPVAAVTKELKGEEFSEIAALKEAGCVALSDDGQPIANAEIMRRALEYSRMFDLPIISHCEDLNLSAKGLMHEGYMATILGLRGIPDVAESIMVARDLQLAEFSQGRLHLAHISAAKSVELIRQAKAKGKTKGLSANTNITAETCPHYFSLTCAELQGFDTNAKVNPPLRSKEDVEAVKLGLSEGIIEVIATDHAPHTQAEKDVEFSAAPFGMIGLETAFSLGLSELVAKRVLTLTQLIAKMSTNPAQILKIAAGTLSVGASADIVIFDPNEHWVVRKEELLSKSKNSPFIGRKLKGIVEYTICGGRIVFSR